MSRLSFFKTVQTSFVYILLFFWIPFLSSCSKGYIIRDGSVYFKDWNESQGRFETKLEGADAESFELLDDTLAKDREAVYAGAKRYPMDVGQFEHLGGAYYRSDSDVFYRTAILIRLRRANPGSFQRLKGLYSTDGTHVYYQYHQLEDIDASSLKVTSEYFCMDDRNVWYLDYKQREIDQASFVDLGEGHARDRYGKIYMGTAENRPSHLDPKKRKHTYE